MAESRVNLTQREYALLMSKAVLMDILVDEKIITQEQVDQAQAKLREIIGEPVFESTVNTPLVADHGDPAEQ